MSTKTNSWVRVLNRGDDENPDRLSWAPRADGAIVGCARGSKVAIAGARIDSESGTVRGAVRCSCASVHVCDWRDGVFLRLVGWAWR